MFTQQVATQRIQLTCSCFDDCSCFFFSVIFKHVSAQSFCVLNGIIVSGVVERWQQAEIRHGAPCCCFDASNFETQPSLSSTVLFQCARVHVQMIKCLEKDFHSKKKKSPRGKKLATDAR